MSSSELLGMDFVASEAVRDWHVLVELSLGDGFAARNQPAAPSGIC